MARVPKQGDYLRELSVPQLVGLPCAICDERIGNMLESAFCATCGNPVHDRCRVPANTASPATCPTCGTNLATAARQAEERERRRQDEMDRRPPPPPLELERAFQFYLSARVIMAAVAAFVVGIMVIVIGETSAGIGAIAAGVGIAALWFFLDRKR